MQPCVLWTSFRSSTVDFPTLGKEKMSLLFTVDTGSSALYSTRPWGYHVSGFQCVKLKCHPVVSSFSLSAIRCLQDAEVLLKLTEEVNETLRNKVSVFSFFSPSCFDWTCRDTHKPSLTTQCMHLFLFPPLPLWFQAPVNTELVRCLSRTARGTLPPLAAAVGGLASQEVLKAITGKFAPLQQWVGYRRSEMGLMHPLAPSTIATQHMKPLVLGFYNISPQFFCVWISCLSISRLSFISMPSRLSGHFSLFLLRSFYQGAIGMMDYELASVNRCV